ncbi:MAG: hypothetical protein AAFR44_05740, partial [Pseudomonadota bacterium]
IDEMRVAAKTAAWVLLTVGMIAGSAHAVPLNLDNDDPPEGQADFQDPDPNFPPGIGFVNDGDRAVAGRYGVTFQNVNVNMPGFGGPVPPGGGVDGDGIIFGRTGDLDVVSFDLFFDIETIILSYDIDFVGFEVEEAAFFGERSSFQIAGPNGTSGENFFDETGNFAFDMGTIPVFLPGVAYTLTHTVPDFGAPFGGFDFVTQIDEFEVVFIPLPAPAFLLLGALGLLALRRRAG